VLCYAAPRPLIKGIYSVDVSVLCPVSVLVHVNVV